jgi:hypothetical protein
MISDLAKVECAIRTDRQSIGIVDLRSDTGPPSPENPAVPVPAMVMVVCPKTTAVKIVKNTATRMA